MRPMPKAKAKAKAKAKTKTTAKPKAGPAHRFERAAYDLPVLDLAEAIALAAALLRTKPAKAPAVVVEEATRLAKALARAKAVGHGGEHADAKAYDVAMDRAWATFVRRIEDWTDLPIAQCPAAIEAAKVHRIVGDLSILKLNYLAEFAQIGARLDSLRREGMLDDAKRFAGDAFLDEVMRCHAAYGTALGVFDAPEKKTSAADRGEARVALVEAIAEYTHHVTALARAGRPESWPAVETALAPIAALRTKRTDELRAPPPPKVPPAHPPV